MIHRQTVNTSLTTDNRTVLYTTPSDLLDGLGRHIRAPLANIFYPLLWNISQQSYWGTMQNILRSTCP